VAASKFPSLPQKSLPFRHLEAKPILGAGNQDIVETTIPRFEPWRAGGIPLKEFPPVELPD
jgi:hypothetical protein